MPWVLQLIKWGHAQSHSGQDGSRATWGQQQCQQLEGKGWIEPLRVQLLHLAIDLATFLR
jgi:hypothetical protein